VYYNKINDSENHQVFLVNSRSVNIYSESIITTQITLTAQGDFHPLVRCALSLLFLALVVVDQAPAHEVLVVLDVLIQTTELAHLKYETNTLK
jgi:hypothetical protein